MKESLFFEKVNSVNLDTYIRVGKNAYREHYRHLWRFGNPSPYVSRSFTLSVLNSDMQNPLNDHYIIRKSGDAIGILKLTQGRVIPPYGAAEVLFLEKIYLLKAHTGTGAGALALRFIENYGRELQKKILTLDAMQKGPAARFYVKEGFSVLRERHLEHPDAIPAERPIFVLGKPI